MSDDYECARCGAKHKREELTQTSSGSLFCSSCWNSLKNEPKRRCPIDDSEMNRHVVSDVVFIDTCSKCGGSWFDRGELDVIRKMWRENGWKEGFFLGWLL